MTSHLIQWNGFSLKLGGPTCIMGVINVTPDSFSDGGLFYDSDKAVAEGEAMARQGAGIIDIGGESTRPFSSEAISEEEELRRVLPVIETLAKRISIPISIDTTKSGVARRALDAGASIINDISALRTDPELGALAAERGVPVILMHMKGTPKTMQVAPRYDDLIGEVKAFLADAIRRAEAAGIRRNRIIVDPGIGFGKTFPHNLCLIKRLGDLNDLNAPILVGSSRKAFIRNLVKPPEEKDMDPLAPEVETGTQATMAAAILNGAHIIRVHNVASTRCTARVIDAIKQVSDNP